jgi:predicted acylesterase/phospholipase RssA
VQPDSVAEQTDDETRDPWRLLRRQQDRRRYLKVAVRRGKDTVRKVDPATGLDRAAHPLLGSPASMTRTATNFPAEREVAEYLAHSCDLTMRGGVAAATVYPMAVCALAEHYVLRRVAGASAGSAAAAAAAAAELGRTAPDPATPVRRPAVAPGFAGLAEIVGWLAGEDAPDQAEQWRLTRMLQPTRETRAPFRLLASLVRARSRTPGTVVRRVTLAALAPPGRSPKLVDLLLWLGFVLAWVGTVVTLVRGAQAAGTGVLAVIPTAVLLAVAFLLAAGFTTWLVYGLAVLRLVQREAEPQFFGLVPGVAPPGRTVGVGGWLDRRAGLPGSGDVPPLADWLAGRLDDLAGMPGGDSRPALTFGDLWLGHTGERTAEDSARLRAAATDPEQRVIDLRLVATDLTRRAPQQLPFPAAAGPAGRSGRSGRSGVAPYVFCETCLAGVLTHRVVVQMVKASPATESDHACPRCTGVLRELPDPWDVPVVLAVRMSLSTPVLLRAVPLFSIDLARRAVHTHWFCDGALTGDAPVHTFDTLLPRWPTFGFSLERFPPESPAEGLRLPAQDAAPAADPWRPVESMTGFTGALLGSALGWQDRQQADAPGFRGRIAQIRHAAGSGRASLFMPQDRLLRMAVRGLHAGAALHDRFTGPDGEVAGQTQTDRYRWIRLRMALREYRGMSSDIAARLPLYSDLASSYVVPRDLHDWFAEPLDPGSRDPLWTDAAMVITTLRAMSVGGGALDFDTDDGAAPVDPVLRLLPPE